MKEKPDIKKLGSGIAKLAAKIGKKNFILAGAVAVVGLAVLLNFLLFTGSADNIGYGNNNMEDNYTGAVGAGGESYFASTQISRQKARDEALEVLQTVLTSADALEATKEQAMSDISRIALDIEQEANIESLVASKGFADCVAVVNGGTVSVVVGSDGLLANEIAQINEIVYEQTGVAPANVKIIEK